MIPAAQTGPAMMRSESLPSAPRSGGAHRPALRRFSRQDPFDRGVLAARGRRARSSRSTAGTSARGWTEWTQGFQFGSALLQFDATGDRDVPGARPRRARSTRMAPHLTHIGVHDHGFNNVSTYGNLWRLAREGRFDAGEWERALLRARAQGERRRAGARAGRRLPGGGFIHSFNGAHSLFVDTIRSLRALALAHQLGHRLLGRAGRADQPARAAGPARAGHRRFSVYYGRGRDAYDVRGRVAHESIFNAANGSYRGPSTQQGYSPFSTWTRGLAWAMLGFAEQLEFLATVRDDDARARIRAAARRRSTAGCSRPRGRPATSTSITPPRPTAFRTGTPARPASQRSATGGTARPTRSTTTSRWTARRPRSPHRACCGSAASSARAARTARATSRPASACSTTLHRSGRPVPRQRRRTRACCCTRSITGPNGWDHVPRGSTIPRGESCQWGDYHLREAALYVRAARDGAGRT